MIVVEMAGGLGNQLFQYAAGRRLALKRGVDLALELSWFAKFSERAFELPFFRVAFRLASRRESRALRGWKRTLPDRILSRALGRPDLLEPPGYYAERSFRFDPRVLSLPAPCYLHGYWQSPRYFDDVAEVLRRELTPASPLGDGARRLGERIRAVDAVSLHVRRGDYLASAAASRTHGVCSLRYYQDSVAAISERVSRPVFFVFTDSPRWVQEHLRIPFETVQVADHGATGPEELWLMSLCRHHVIANSSFSWWGAWLDPRPDALVVAPGRWFETDAHDTSDLLPQGWLRVAS